MKVMMTASTASSSLSSSPTSPSCSLSMCMETNVDVLFARLRQAITNGATPPFIERIIDRNPIILKHGYNILNEIFELNFQRLPSPAVLELLIRKAPENVRCKGFSENLPLHCLCQRDDCTLELVQVLVNAYPNSVQEKCYWNRTPLHLACSCDHPSFEVIRFLLQCYPEAAFQKDQSRYTPLHCACHRPQPRQEVIQIFAHCDSNSLKERTERGSTPLHILCSRPSSGDSAAAGMIQLTLEACPDAAIGTDHGGNTPLHLACMGKNFEAVQVLCQRMPSLCIFVNKLNQTPYVYCCINNHAGGSGTGGGMSRYTELLEATGAALVGQLLDSKKQMPLEMVHSVAERLAQIIDTRPHPSQQQLEEGVRCWNNNSNSLPNHNNRFNRHEANKELQELLLNAQWKKLLRMYRMIDKAGRKQLEQSGNNNKAFFVQVCAKLVNDHDCLYFLLREHVDYFCF